MRSDEDDLLVAALGAMGGGSGVGARFAARRLKKSVLEVDVELRLPPAAAADRVRQVIGELGQVLPLDGTDAHEVVGVLGAGAMNLNPAIVTVTVSATDSGSRLVVRGAAKEGLIKQRAGEQAARRVAQALA